MWSRSRDICEALREVTKGANSIGADAFADVREAETAVLIALKIEGVFHWTRNQDYLAILDLTQLTLTKP